MDVIYASYYIFNENGNKGSQMGHTKKIFIKKHYNKLNLCCVFESDTRYKWIKQYKCNLDIFNKDILIKVV